MLPPALIFALPTSFNQRRRSDGQTFYCPNGHRRVYQETDVQRERKARERAEDGPPSGAGDGGGTDATASTPPAVTLPDDWRDRIACSVRSFQNLHKHMAGQHPGYVEGPEA